MKDIYEFTDDELEIIRDIIVDRVNWLSKQRNIAGEVFYGKTWDLSIHLLSKIETIIQFRQGNIDIDANIETELE